LYFSASRGSTRGCGLPPRGRGGTRNDGASHDKRLKARLVVKGYTQTFAIDYLETPPVARLHSMRSMLSMSMVKQWPLYDWH